MSSLILKNQRVYQFYDRHKHFDFEKMNILLFDLLENFQESAIPSLNANMAAKLFQQIEQMQMQINEQYKFNQLDVLKQLSEWKTKHIEDVQNIIQNNHINQVLPLLRDQVERFHEKMVHLHNQTSTDDSIQSHHDIVKKSIQSDFDKLCEKTLSRTDLQEFVRTVEDRLCSLMNASEMRLQERFRDHTHQLEDIKRSGYGQEQMKKKTQDLLLKPIIFYIILKQMSY